MAKSAEFTAANGYIKIEHDFGYFLDVKKYKAITNHDDESIAILKLSLMLENYLSILINNLRKEGTERFVKDGKYFAQKLEVSVALGLPVALAEPIYLINKIRNKFAHHLDYEISDRDVENIISLVSKIKVGDVNHYGYLDDEAIGHFFGGNIKIVDFVKEILYTTSDKKKRVIRLVGVTFILSNIAAFYLINEMHGRCIFKTTPAEG
ncbi:hypothetical protein KDV93_22445 [Serratia ureilytica]|uniref:hypothetical protein n=1 Tax=Serratia ureilytica TaxID=300181 RepID=UPI003325BFAC